MKSANCPNSVRRVVVANDFGSVTGGASRVAIESALGLAEAGVRVDYLCCVPPVDERLARHKGIRTHVTGQPDIASHSSRLRAALGGLWNFKAARAVELVLSRCDPAESVVHVHSFTKALSAAAVAAAAGEFETVLTLHDYFAVCPGGGLYDHKRQRPCPHAPMSLGCLLAHCDSRSRLHKLWRVARQLGVSRAMRARRLHFLFTSRACRELAEPLLPFGHTSYTLANPVGIEKGPRVEAAANRSIAFVGELSERKGVLLLAEALATFEREAIFIGDGAAREKILRLLPSARITGWVAPEEVRRLLAECRFLVFPSLWPESQPLVPYEARAMGLPVVATACSAGAESVEPDVTGLVAAPEARALAQALAALDDDALVDRLSRAGYDSYWQEPLSLERHVAGLCDIYRRLLARRDPNP